MSNKRIYMKTQMAKFYNRYIYCRIRTAQNTIVKNLPKIPLTVDEKVAVHEEYKGRLNLKFNLDWFAHYKFYRGDVEVRSVPKDLWMYMERSLNPVKYRLLQHKGMLHRIIDKKYLPVTIINKMFGVILDENDNVVSEADAIERLISHNAFVYKPTVHTGGGKGVELVAFDSDNMDDRKRKIEPMIRKDNFICQDLISCSGLLTRYNKYEVTVNTIRCFSFYMNGQVSVLSSYMRMGGGKTINDNVCLKTAHNNELDTASCYVGIREDGTLCDFAVNMISNYQKHFKSPSGLLLKGEKIGFYDRIKESVISLHKHLPMLKFIAWDITLDSDDNIRIIEINLDSQDIEDHHIFNGAIFASRFEELCDYVRANPPSFG